MDSNPLFAAITQGDTTLVANLINKAPLLLKIQNSNSAQFETNIYLLGESLKGMNALQYALCIDDFDVQDIIALLVAASSIDDINKSLWGNQNTSLHLASYMGESDVCAALLKKGAIATLKNLNGLTAADVAADEETRGVFRKIVSKAADDRRDIIAPRLESHKILDIENGPSESKQNITGASLQRIVSAALINNIPDITHASVETIPKVDIAEKLGSMTKTILSNHPQTSKNQDVKYETSFSINKPDDEYKSLKISRKISINTKPVFAATQQDSSIQSKVGSAQSFASNPWLVSDKGSLGPSSKSIKNSSFFCSSDNLGHNASRKSLNSTTNLVSLSKSTGKSDWSAKRSLPAWDTAVVAQIQIEEPECDIRPASVSLHINVKPDTDSSLIEKASSNVKMIESDLDMHLDVLDLSASSDQSKANKQAEQMNISIIRSSLETKTTFNTASIIKSFERSASAPLGRNFTMPAKRSSLLYNTFSSDAIARATPVMPPSDPIATSEAFKVNVTGSINDRAKFFMEKAVEAGISLASKPLIYTDIISSSTRRTVAVEDIPSKSKDNANRPVSVDNDIYRRADSKLSASVENCNDVLSNSSSSLGGESLLKAAFSLKDNKLANGATHVMSLIEARITTSHKQIPIVDVGPLFEDAEYWFTGILGTKEPVARQDSGDYPDFSKNFVLQPSLLDILALPKSQECSQANVRDDDQSSGDETASCLSESPNLECEELLTVDLPATIAPIKKPKKSKSWEPELENRKYIAVDAEPYTKHNPNASGLLLIHIERIEFGDYSVFENIQCTANLTVRCGFETRACHDVYIDTGNRDPIIIQYDCKFEHTSNMKIELEFWIKEELVEDSMSTLETSHLNQKKPSIKSVGKRLLGSLNKKLGLQVLSEGFDFSVCPKEMEIPDPTPQPFKLLASTILDCHLTSNLEPCEKSIALISSQQNKMIGQLHYKVLAVPFSRNVEISLLPDNIHECDYAMEKYHEMNKTWVEGSLTLNFEKRLYKLCGKVLTAYDMESNIPVTSYNLSILDFVAGPSVELMLNDADSLEQSKRFIKSMLAQIKIEESCMLNNNVAAIKKVALIDADFDPAYFIDCDEFLFEFKDGAVLRFRAENATDSLRWILAMTKLWLFSVKNDIPEWVYACV